MHPLTCRAGEVGYFSANIKAVDHARVGDTITHASKRRRYGEDMDCEPSRFLNELPEQHIERSGGGQKLDPEVSKARGRAHLAALKDLLS